MQVASAIVFPRKIDDNRSSDLMCLILKIRNSSFYLSGNMNPPTLKKIYATRGLELKGEGKRKIYSQHKPRFLQEKNKVCTWGGEILFSKGGNILHAQTVGVNA